MKNSKLTWVAIMITVSLLLIFIINITGRDKKNSYEMVSETSFFLNTFVTVSVYDSAENYTGGIKDRNELEKLVKSAVSLCGKYENIFSRTAASSELYKINSLSGEKLEISKELYEIINKSLEYALLSEGAFDITISPLSDLWNYDKRTVPSGKMIEALLEKVDYNNIDLYKEKDKYYISAKNGSTIDLGGIAKGYIADRIKEYLEKAGVKSGIINLGGNTVVIGEKPDNTNYNIAVKRPFSETGKNVCSVMVNDKSVVTSGIYERYFIENGNLYHHIINPKTGYPVDNNIYSVTIISENSVDGDALSTICLILGQDKALELINTTENTECIIIDSEYNIIISDGLNINNKIITLK